MDALQINCKLLLKVQSLGNMFSCAFGHISSEGMAFTANTSGPFVIVDVFSGIIDVV